MRGQHGSKSRSRTASAPVMRRVTALPWQQRWPAAPSPAMRPSRRRGTATEGVGRSGVLFLLLMWMLTAAGAGSAVMAQAGGSAVVVSTSDSFQRALSNDSIDMSSIAGAHAYTVPHRHVALCHCPAHGTEMQAADCIRSWHACLARHTIMLTEDTSQKFDGTCRLHAHDCLAPPEARSFL